MTEASRAIDVHAHVYPAVYLDRLEEIGVDPATTAIARDLGADSTDADMSARLKLMGQAGVETQVLAVTPQSPSGVEPARPWPPHDGSTMSTPGWCVVTTGDSSPTARFRCRLSMRR